MTTSRSPAIRLVTIDLSFHHAAAGIVHAVLEQYGVNVTEVRRPHEAAFQLFREGEADLLCAAWLPGSHGVYLDAMVDPFERVCVLYTPFALWGVPEYVPADQVLSVADLARPEVAARMVKRIQGIGPGAGISRFSREIIDAYGLAAHGYHFENGSLDDCVSAFEQAVREQCWAVVPLWQPQYLHWTHRIRPLAEPRGLLRGMDEATLLLHASARERLPVSAVQALRALSPGNAEMTRLDFEIVREGRSALEAGRRYLVRSAHPVA
ncbi:glycine betaine ABC transporter substrate-binding protein [Ralstonia pickettii]|uniref:glycine betaine ABC transporter substrate-binding protein n=1 Tax=Ralstonia pickettii TaxID=329 RepID=UPI0008189977|nr:glycine betaine ABC transporter substrate-binding protein [Ralstonia pickettii]OCS43740.1 glycine/betaine ABC transporter substrate-binding protein [Ralstonia pickettii]